MKEEATAAARAEAKAAMTGGESGERCAQFWPARVGSLFHGAEFLHDTPANPHIISQRERERVCVLCGVCLHGHWAREVQLSSQLSSRVGKANCELSCTRWDVWLRLRKTSPTRSPRGSVTSIGIKEMMQPCLIYLHVISLVAAS